MTAWRRHIRVILIIFLIFGLGACRSGKDPKSNIQPSGKLIHIGIIAPLSGKDDPKGKDGLKGIQFMLHRRPLLNNGSKIKIQVEDDQGKPELSVTAFKKLVEKNRVSAILILSDSDCVLEINKIVDSYRTPVIATIASHPMIAESKQYMNQLCIDNNFQGKFAAVYVRDELLATRGAVFIDVNSEYSVSLADVFKENFIKLGGEIEEFFLTSGREEEIKDALQFLKQVETEVIYMPLPAEQFLLISRLLAEMNWEPIRFGRDGLLATVLSRYSDQKNLINGVIGIDFYSTDAGRFALNRSLVRTYAKLFDSEPNTYTIAGAESIALLMDAMNRAKSGDTQGEINQQIRKTKNFMGFNGRVTIDSKGKSQRPLIINTIEHDKLKFVVRVH
jgi:branched-chain amino acid transport system substrate-binding protein